jgi:hypothetical protein
MPEGAVGASGEAGDATVGTVTAGAVTEGAVGATGAVAPGADGAAGAALSTALMSDVESGTAEGEDASPSVGAGVAGIVALGGSSWSGWPFDCARAAGRPRPIRRAAAARPQNRKLLRQAVIRDRHFHMLGGRRQIDAAEHHGGADDADDHESEEDSEQSFHRLVTLSVTSSSKRISGVLAPDRPLEPIWRESADSGAAGPLYSAQPGQDCDRNGVL